MLSTILSAMLNTQQIKGLTDLRLNPAAIALLAKQEGPVYIFNRSKPVSVLIDIEEYEDLVDRLEDALDAEEIKEMKKTAKKEDFVSWENLKKELGLSPKIDV